jgi:hypothetical protein
VTRAFHEHEIPTFEEMLMAGQPNRVLEWLLVTARIGEAKDSFRPALAPCGHMSLIDPFLPVVNVC